MSARVNDLGRPVLVHLVDRKPESATDTSRVLCIRAGDRVAGGWLLPKGQRTAAWTMQGEKVTCPNCLEWMHA